jgi:hypothetical protein
MARETLDLIERALSLLSLLGTAALAFRLVVEKLIGVYPFFFAWLVAEVLRATAFLLMRPRSNLYGWTFVYTEPVIWILYFLTVWELYSLVLRYHPGLASMGKRTMMLVLAIALILVAASLRTDLSNPSQDFPTLLLAHVAGRAVVSTLGVFLLLITAVLLWFPIPLNSNTVNYCVGYAVFFCTKAIVLLFRNAMGPGVVQYASVVNVAVANLCIFFWLWTLRQEGERRPRAVATRWSPGEADRLMHQLGTINDALLRVSRKR